MRFTVYKTQVYITLFAQNVVRNELHKWRELLLNHPVFKVYSTMLSVSQTKQCLVTKWFINNELRRMNDVKKRQISCPSGTEPRFFDHLTHSIVAILTKLCWLLNFDYDSIHIQETLIKNILRWQISRGKKKN
jgi:hypothetical protein